MKKKTPEYWRKRCTTLAKKIVRTKSKFTCEYCGKNEPNVQTHGSHIYGEGVYKSMSADLDNIICLCFTHHTGGWNAKEPSWHQDPMEMTAWLKEKYPERCKRLRIRSQTTKQVDWEKKLIELKTLEGTKWANKKYKKALKRLEL